MNRTAYTYTLMEERIKTLEYTGAEIGYKYESVLLIEDSETDFYIFRRLFEKGRVARKMRHSLRAEEALDFLFNCEEQEVPDVIVVDVNLQYGISGLDFLAAYYRKKGGKMPRIVLTTSHDYSVKYNLDTILRRFTEVKLVVKPINNVVHRELQLEPPDSENAFSFSRY
ncbi:MAG: hypothetical protein AB1458_15040 [Bacteroidota bacterium]